MNKIIVILAVTWLSLPTTCFYTSPSPRRNHFNDDNTIKLAEPTDESISLDTDKPHTLITTSGETQRPRLIILADMGNEPDEEQQMAHMLVNCSEFELEGLIAVTGKFLKEDAGNAFKRVVHPELFHKLIDGYAQVETNLRLHDDGWPTAEYLHRMVEPGQAKYGLADVGAGKSTEGSQRIVRAREKDDPRPLNIVVNAGSNTLAQALIDPTADWPRPALTACGENMFSRRSDRYRYIRYADGSEEVYDHDADLHEWENLAESQEIEAVKAKLKAMLPTTSAESLGGRNG